MANSKMQYKRFLPQVLAAIRSGNLEAFERLVGTPTVTNCSKKEIIDLLDFQEQETKNTVFHDLLSEDFKWFGKKKRHARAVIFSRLLNIAKSLKKTELINSANSAGVTPLHIAIQKGYTNLVEKLLWAGADIAKSTQEGISTLELAAKFKHEDIYKKLLAKHNELNKRSEQAAGYTCAQIDAAKNIRIETLKRKQVALGIFGTIMTIACPVGAVLAFNELPLLELFFAGLIPGIGPFIGLGGAIIFGLLLYLSVYQKSGEKYGAYAQEMTTLDATSAKLLRLEAEWKQLNQRLKNTPQDVPTYQSLIAARNSLQSEFDTIYETIPFVEEDFNAMPSDSTDSSDEFRTYMLTGASFLCAFSGIMGLIGGITSFIPALTATAAVFLGIPVVGWVALGIALGVGIAVAAWAYHAKFKPTLIQCGQAAEKLNAKKCALSKKKEEYMESRSALTPGFDHQNILNIMPSPSDGIQINKQANQMAESRKPGIPDNDVITFKVEEAVSMAQLMQELSINSSSRKRNFKQSLNGRTLYVNPDFLFSETVNNTPCT